jgi:hypothetical protein
MKKMELKSRWQASVDGDPSITATGDAIPIEELAADRAGATGSRRRDDREAEAGDGAAGVAGGGGDLSVELRLGHGAFSPS